MTNLAHALVTGARGFIGRRLVQRLVRNGTHVVCLDHPVAAEDTLRGLPVHRVSADVRDRSAVERAIQEAGDLQTVFHLAAATAPRALSAARATNVQGTRHLADRLARRGSPPVFVYVSSLAVAGPRSEPSTETMPCRPVSIYGRTKLEAEQVLEQRAGMLPVTIVRPSCVFGPGDRNLLSLFQSIRRGWNFFSDPQFKYSLLYVDDLVSVLLAAGERGRRLPAEADPQHTGIYYAADPHAVTFPELGALIARSLDRHRVRQVRVPPLLGWTAATLGQAAQWALHRRVYFNLDKAREAYGGSWMCDPRRAIEQLAVSPAADLEHRLAETRDSYRQDRWLPPANA